MFPKEQRRLIPRQIKGKSEFSVELANSIRRELAEVGAEGCVFTQLVSASRPPGWVNGRHCTSHWKGSNMQDMPWEKENVL